MLFARLPVLPRGEAALSLHRPFVSSSSSLTFLIVASKQPRCSGDADPRELNPPQASAARGSEPALSVRSGTEGCELARSLGLGAAAPGGHLQFHWAPGPSRGPRQKQPSLRDSSPPIRMVPG